MPGKKYTKLLSLEDVILGVFIFSSYFIFKFPNFL